MAKQVKKAQRRPVKKAAAKKRVARKVAGGKTTQVKSQPKRRFAKSDPILTEIIRNGVLAVTEEMKSNLMRTAYNMIIYEALDFTVGLYTPEGDTISIGLGLPMFIRGMAETVRAKLRHFGKDGLQEGDILVTNDAYLTGSHLNHFTFSLPIFFEGELCGFACCMAHWPDVGGTLGGVTTDIYSEGIQIPIVKYQRAGVVNQDLVDIIRMNVRLPDRAMGDLRAQITAVKTGERRFKELLARYGRAETLAAIGNIMAQSERSARARTREIPDGVYEATSYMDDDGVDIGKRVPIKVKVTVKGDEMSIDLTEVSAQVRGFYNSGETTGIACAQVAYKCLTSPTDYPINEGSFRTLNVALAKGTIISAVKPAPMRWWMTFPMTIVDTIFKALAPAIPDRVIAGHHADLLSTNLHGIHPRTGGFFMGGFGPLGGGWGAKMTEDGMSATVCLNDGDTHNSPVESVEAKFPFLIEELSLRSGSGGAGKFRGGLGIARKVSARVPLTLNAQVERMHCAPWGLEGGHDGFGNEVTVYDANGEKRDVANAKVFLRRLQPGEGFYSRSGGGGGFGSPLERDPIRVAHDVAEEYVSAEEARTVYGVVLDADGAADLAETQKLRATLGGKQA
ncbi:MULTISPECIES: hydantoinase B/oxoprolinase family protein [unclassified Beijerinckia]|uniref:hydantoinase B/oxoprolinase family protein n=1 Tax=unclassified Beijerinckia TaxID=2638183 RepID=UPI00089640C2|nr:MULTISPECIES: hydantoinase B/oxoprolinase family protein [unclassified Beijerinckia]MDH7797308.1 N-methylhydantoinase B [Beijerinckia sp. GAS462]SEC80382.1 N-methylhydantoinase B [Beijerinckia sp. 28-YEA-48]